MANQNAPNNIGKEPNPNSRVETVSQTPRDQHEPSTASSNTAKDDKDKTRDLEQDIRSGERWLIGIGIATVVINTIIALIYWGQLKEMRKATDAATQSARAAESTLREIQKGGTDTHDLAIAAKDQAKTYNDIAEQTKLNGTRSDKALNSTVAEFQLEQRAWLSITVTGDEPIVGKKDIVTVHMHNTGKTYGINLQWAVYITATYDVGLTRPPISPPFRNLVDFGPAAMIAPGDTAEHDSFLNSPDGSGLTAQEVDGLKAGKSVVWMYGKVKYDDVFGKHHWVKFCFYRAYPDPSFLTCFDKGSNEIDNN